MMLMMVPQRGPNQFDSWDSTTNINIWRLLGEDDRLPFRLCEPREKDTVVQEDKASPENL